MFTLNDVIMVWKTRLGLKNFIKFCGHENFSNNDEVYENSKL